MDLIAMIFMEVCYKKYDLIFGIGRACSCSTFLRMCELQKYSYPFDWISGLYFNGAIKVLSSKFERFIELDDLYYGSSPVENDIYFNKYNGITFNHDFPKNYGEDKETAFLAVKEKYNRRIKRLLNKITESRKILIVYLEIINVDDVENEQNTDMQIIQGYEEILSAFRGGANIFSRLYRKNIDMIYIHHDPKAKKSVSINKLHCGLQKISLNYRLDNVHHNSVDFEKLEKLIKRIRLR
jgi:hypothetical protein